jgi:hypothetical protein
MSGIEFVNCGAVDGNGQRIPTKAKLKEVVARAARAIAEGDEHGDDFVMFDQTAMMMSGRIPGNATVKDLMNAPVGTQLQVVGPDPYNSRKWYATVKADKNGKVTVK